MYVCMYVRTYGRAYVCTSVCIYMYHVFSHLWARVFVRVVCVQVCLLGIWGWSGCICGGCQYFTPYRMGFWYGPTIFCLYVSEVWPLFVGGWEWCAGFFEGLKVCRHPEEVCCGFLQVSTQKGPIPLSCLDFPSPIRGAGSLCPAGGVKTEVHARRYNPKVQQPHFIDARKIKPYFSTPKAIYPEADGSVIST